MKKAVLILIIVAAVLTSAAAPITASAAQAEPQYKAEVAYNDFLLSGGDILRNFTFWVNRDYIKEGLTVAAQRFVDTQTNAVMSAIQGYFEDNGFNVSYEEGSGFLEVTVEYYESYTDMYIALGIDGYEKSSSTAETETGFLFNTSRSTRSTVFKQIKEKTFSDQSVLKLLNDSIVQLLAIDGMTESDISYVYNYGTKYSTRLISSDADAIYTHEKFGITIHKFAMDSGTMTRDITLTQTTPNAPAWYGLAFAVTAVVAGGAVGLTIYTSKKKKRE